MIYSAICARMMCACYEGRYGGGRRVVCRPREEPAGPVDLAYAQHLDACMYTYVYVCVGVHMCMCICDWYACICTCVVVNMCML